MKFIFIFGSVKITDRLVYLAGKNCSNESLYMFLLILRKMVHYYAGTGILS